MSDESGFSNLTKGSHIIQKNYYDERKKEKYTFFSSRAELASYPKGMTDTLDVGQQRFNLRQCKVKHT